MELIQSIRETIHIIEAQRNIFGVCPHCQNLFRLSDIKLSYRREFPTDWFGELKLQETKIVMDHMKIEDALKSIKESATEQARTERLPEMLSQVDPIFTPLGYYPQDVKAVFDPLDFVIFDGMNREKNVKRIVFMDECTTNATIRQIQSSIENAIRNGKCGFQSIRLTDTGQIKTQ